ncbi:hypothetical protein [Amycolatopsis sp. ATCC 39116]|uniref:hypothetical protein n=1 Tax=Amycolatopsis sp. (strain ATCC 39116 / 75iv2) TaxID=385957 RepID=UPI0012FC4E70|nr:hypothetical protein [Amycolatopsis sp. ATCC 39116]
MDETARAPRRKSLSGNMDEADVDRTGALGRGSLSGSTDEAVVDETDRAPGRNSLSATTDEADVNGTGALGRGSLSSRTDDGVVDGTGGSLRREPLSGNTDEADVDETCRSLRREPLSGNNNEADADETCESLRGESLSGNTGTAPDEADADGSESPAPRSVGGTSREQPPSLLGASVCCGIDEPTSATPAANAAITATASSCARHARSAAGRKSPAASCSVSNPPWAKRRSRVSSRSNGTGSGIAARAASAAGPAAVCTASYSSRWLRAAQF